VTCESIVYVLCIATDQRRGKFKVGAHCETSGENCRDSEKKVRTCQSTLCSAVFFFAFRIMKFHMCARFCLIFQTI